MRLAVLVIAAGALIAPAAHAEDPLCDALRDYANNISLDAPKTVTVKADWGAEPTMGCVHDPKDKASGPLCKALNINLSIEFMAMNVQRVQACTFGNANAQAGAHSPTLEPPAGSFTTRVPAFTRRGLVFTAKYDTVEHGSELPFLTITFAENKEGALDYDQLVMLDAEALAETGIAEAYEKLLPQLRRYAPSPEAIEEVADPDTPTYAIRFRGRLLPVYGPDVMNNSWGQATYVFFKLVNDQLVNAPVWFYAINSGNDLGGMFLTAAQVAAARKNSHKADWPYLPTQEPEWFGQPH